MGARRLGGIGRGRHSPEEDGQEDHGAQWQRDPLSPAFRPNLVYALRFLQCSVLLPLHLTVERRARAIPIGFELAPCVKKPGRRASEEELRAYKLETKERNLSVTFARSLTRSRERLDDLGAASRLHVVTVDGSFLQQEQPEQHPGAHRRSCQGAQGRQAVF